MDRFVYIYEIKKTFNEKDFFILDEDFICEKVFVYSAESRDLENLKDVIFRKGTIIRCDKEMRMDSSSSYEKGHDRFAFSILKKYNKDINTHMKAKKVRIDMKCLNGMMYSKIGGDIDKFYKGYQRKAKIEKILE